MVETGRDVPTGLGSVLQPILNGYGYLGRWLWVPRATREG
jgi:hypothetical protein